MGICRRLSVSNRLTRNC